MKIKITKNELKRQREALQRFSRYLPTLQIKKQQLQYEIGKINHALSDLTAKLDALEKDTSAWVDVFAENIKIEKILQVKEVKTDTGNVAGIDIPVFVDMEFKEIPYNLMLAPLWLDRGIEVCRQMIDLRTRSAILRKQRDVLKEELRITTQRVNLFEKVKIPEARENIRIIRIYLGDLQTAEVVRGKIAKTKIENRRNLS